ncbi:MAG: hypothetical protein U0T36_05175 [Saprospiraceae bacterium]
MEERLLNEIVEKCAIEEDLKTSVMPTIQLEKLVIVSTLFMKYFYRKEGIMLFEKTLKLSKRYKEPILILKTLTSILNHYSFVEPNNKLMKKTEEDIEYYTGMLLGEFKLRTVYAKISNMYVMNKGKFSKLQMDEIHQMILQVDEIKNKYKTNFTITQALDLSFFYYQTIGDYFKGLEVATKGLAEIEKFEVKDLFGIYQTKKNIAICHFFLKNYNESSKWFQETIGMVTVGSRNWINTTGLYFLNLIQANQYNELYILSCNVISNKNLVKFPIYVEQWMIREAYLHFLVRMGKIDDDVIKLNPIRSFSVNKFLNSMTFHAKDKTGQNITIQVLQILFYLLDSKYNKIIDRIDTLTQYTYRYLNKDDTFRSNNFIKMLLLMVKADFHPVRTANYTASLSKQLSNSKVVIDERSAQVEIIPYDRLWEMTMELLHNLHKKDK